MPHWRRISIDLVEIATVTRYGRAVKEDPIELLGLLEAHTVTLLKCRSDVVYTCIELGERHRPLGDVYSNNARVRLCGDYALNATSAANIENSTIMLSLYHDISKK